MFLKRLLYASASLLMLALAYHLGASTAVAQAPSNPVVGMAYGGSAAFAATADGDTYVWDGTSWRRFGNIFSGAPAPATTQSFGALKAKYR